MATTSPHKTAFTAANCVCILGCLTFTVKPSHCSLGSLDPEFSESEEATNGSAQKPL